MSKDAEEKQDRILILCVDRDDDLGAKTGVKTPVLGRTENVIAATNLALKDPEEPDANAIFEAVRIYDRLSGGVETHENYQIATITGSGLGGLGADKKIISELTDVLKAFLADDVVLVTDGYSDEATLPLIQSRVPVTSIKRVVMKHSESIEETAAVFSRYLKTLVDNPRYSRFVVGLPGVLMLVFVTLWLLNLLLYAWIAFLIIVGSFLFVKGFHVDKTIKYSYKWVREFSPPPLPKQMMVFSVFTGILLIGVGLYQAGAFVSPLLQHPAGKHVGRRPDGRQVAAHVGAHQHREIERVGADAARFGDAGTDGNHDDGIGDIVDKRRQGNGNPHKNGQVDRRVVDSGISQPDGECLEQPGIVDGGDDNENPGEEGEGVPVELKEHLPCVVYPDEERGNRQGDADKSRVVPGAQFAPRDS